MIDYFTKKLKIKYVIKFIITVPKKSNNRDTNKYDLFLSEKQSIIFSLWIKCVIDNTSEE